MILKKFDNKRILMILIPIMLFFIWANFVYAGWIEGIDQFVYEISVKYMNPILNFIIISITNFGGVIGIPIICVLLLLFSKTRKSIGVPISISVVISLVVNLFFKRLFGRERPNILQLVEETTYSFPSGHSMVNATICTMLIMLAIRYIKNVKLKIITIIGCILYPVLIGYTRIYLGVHYFGDIIGGFLLGIAVGIFVDTLLKKDETKQTL